MFKMILIFATIFAFWAVPQRLGYWSIKASKQWIRDVIVWIGGYATGAGIAGYWAIVLWQKDPVLFFFVFGILYVVWIMFFHNGENVGKIDVSAKNCSVNNPKST